MRDSQRSRVYKSDKEVDRGQLLSSLEGVKDFVMRVRMNGWLRKRYEKALAPHIQVKDGRGRRGAAGNHNYITVPKWSRTPLILCHELAHTISWRMADQTYKKQHIAGHGVEFCMVYLDLVQAMMGAEARKSLEERFKVNKVRYRPKKVFTPEALARLRERGRALAACRKKEGDDNDA